MLCLKGIAIEEKLANVLVTEYVPAASEPLNKFRSEPKEEDKQNGEEAATATGAGTETGKADSKSIASEASAGPERPHHDTQIEEFLREQHRSQESDEMKKAAKGLTS